MTMDIGGQPVSLPPGWQIEVGREGAAIINGQSLPGINFNLTHPATNANTTVFVPYSVLSNVTEVSKMFAKRVTAIQAAQGLAGGT